MIEISISVAGAVLAVLIVGIYINVLKRLWMWFLRNTYCGQTVCKEKADAITEKSDDGLALARIGRFVDSVLWAFILFFALNGANNVAQCVELFVRQIFGLS